MKNFIISLISLIKFSNLNLKKKEFVFYSESYFYRYHFIDLMNSLNNFGLNNIVFVTSDKKDFFFFKKKFNCFLIENKFILSIFFKLLKCKFMIMTLTDIGNHFHKSKYCNNYVYFFHALASTHKIYTHTAFKNYDLIFTNGDYQKKELELSETKFDFPKKEIINSGYFFFDSLRNKANFNKLKKKTIIFAPSWNYNKINLFDDYGLKIIDQLLNSNFKVILRPHPEHFHRSKKTLKKITDLFLKNPGFELDQNSNNLESLEQSEILITDNSAIVFEFLLIFKRPIIYIEYSDKIHNDKIELIPLKTLESEFKENFGNIISINNLTDLSKLCEELSNNNNLSSNKIDSFTNKYVSNVNNSANFASKYLIEKLNEIK